MSRARGKIKTALAKPSAVPSGATILLVLIFLVAGGLRIPGLFTDFWGDEIWSWRIAGQLHGVTDIFLAEPARIDNNHPLNTLWLYWMGQNQPVWAYRLPALLAGVGTVLAAARIMRRLGKSQALIAALLFAFSYPLVFYSSEARGYSLCVFFSLLSFDFLQTALTATSQKNYGAEFLFGICCLLGFLSHLTFLNLYMAAVVWSMIRVRQLEPTTGLRLARLARLHTIPVLGALLLFRVFVANMVYGGAAPTKPWAIVVQTLSLALGGPEAGPMARFVSVIAVALFIASLVFLARQGSSTWAFFAVAVLIAPALICLRAVVFTDRPQPLMLRYFLIPIAMLLLAIVPWLAHLWRRGGAYRLVFAMALAAYLSGNLWSLGSFLMVGRGHYAEALAAIAQQTTGPVIELSSNNPLRTEPLLEFYGTRVAPGRRVTVTTEPKFWLILNRTEPATSKPINYRNYLYSMDGSYPSASLSGWTWQVYRMQTAATSRE